MFTLTISCLTASNLPWFMDLTFQVPCNIALYSIRVYFHHQSHPQLCVVFSLAPSLHFSGFISPLISSSIFGPYWSGEFPFSILSFCLFILFMGLSRQEYWSGLPFSSPVDHILLEFSTMTCLSWMALHSMAHSFIELDKAVVLVWLYWLAFCEYGSSVHV